MYFPSTSLFQSNNKSTEAAPQPKESTFKTSNPQIFPSLNPLGALYKQRKVVHPNPLVHEHSDALEPVKKVKLNSGVEERASTTFTQPQRENLDKDGFRTPKLPKRLTAQNKRQGLDGVYNPKVVQGFKTVKENRQNKGQNKGKNTEQKMEVLYHGIDPLAWSAMYDQLRLEYIAFQLSQNAELFYQMYQNNQFSLSESLMKEKINQVVRC